MSTLRTPVGFVIVSVKPFIGTPLENEIVVAGYSTCNQMVADLISAALKTQLGHVSGEFKTTLIDHDSTHVTHVKLYDEDDEVSVVKGILSIPGSFKV